MKKLLWFTFFWTALLNPVYAKWATFADAPSKYEINTEIEVNQDGTTEEIVEITKELLTEIGRSNDANITLYYNGDSEKIELFDAKTTYKGREHKLDRTLIEDKPLASSYEGFDQYRQVLLAFPKTEIGAKVSAKYKLIVNKPPLDNFYAETFHFGYNKFDANRVIKIKSKLPLHILVNDPEHSLKITETKNKDFYNLEIILKKPLFKLVTNEPGPTIVDPKKYTWVSVSSIKKWEDLAIKQGELIAKTFSQQLPKDFVTILKKAQKKNNDIDQINTVTSLLNDKIRYMGDWRSISGRFVPRDLDKISKTQLGDCKDFSAVTAAILTKLGYQTQIVAVRRGIDLPSLEILPGFEAFNHMMVKVTNKQGKVYWIDPTNFESMAGGIFPDIANKMALILDPKQPGYEKIPGVNSQSAVMILNRQLEIPSANTITETGDVTLKNEITLGITGAALKVSKETIKNSLFYVLADYTNLEEKNKKRMSLPKLDSRIVNDITIIYSFVRENDTLQTNMGPALKLTYSEVISKLYNIVQDHVSDTLLETFPFTLKRQTLVKNINATNVASLNKEIKTPWLDIKRTCNFIHNHDLQIDDTMILHKNLIESSDYTKPEFIALKNWLKSNFKDVIIVFDQNIHAR